MNYCVINEQNIITNVVVAEPDVAEQMGFLSLSDGQGIGDEYKAPEPEKQTPIPDEQTIEYMNNSIQDGIDLV